MTKTFKEFSETKIRETKKQLKTVKRVLEKQGFTVDSCLEDDDDPYIFVHSGNQQLSFEGVRIYKVSGIMAYRVQKEKETHPYGKAYELNLENIFNDLMAENGDESKSGHGVIKTVGEQFKKFFKKSVDAEQELKSIDVEKSSEDGVSVRNANLDYSTMIGSTRA